eukprot:TRINITY_DN1334_c0_g1_i2.p1 TRINITY_DN1334_c0_g1~~TRINITY_DN1334_c0_g1_i2.p1  ORF type:complete len:903 (+),score=270.47 TRINITY_DN1334_c0_g1_i2:76-2784(+)
MTNDGNSIKVCVRVRPFAARESGEFLCVDMPKTSTTEVILKSDRSSKDKGQAFSFDRCFWSHSEDSRFATQATLMDEIGRPMSKNLRDGYNTCLFAYGQTGSGKTHSMLGAETPPDARGILPRIIEAMFEDMEAEKQGKAQSFVTSASYLEIYNEHIRDLLLLPGQQTAASGKLEVRSHPKLGVYVPGLSEHHVDKQEQVQKIIAFGAKTRIVGATSMNAASSRSHCIFTFRMEKTCVENGVKSQTRSALHLVDLAGSERQKKTGATGERLREGANINQSLTNLAACISALAKLAEGKGHADHIPFRNSKLTYLLSDSLGGNSKTVLMAAISPALSNYEESLSTLKFAHTCKRIKTKAVKNEESTESVVNSLQEELARLKKQAVSPTETHRSTELTMQIQELLDQARKETELRDKALHEMGISLSDLAGVVNMDPDTPQLVNISEDPSLNGALVYYLPMAENCSVGSDTKCKIVLKGLGVADIMCHLRNEDNETVTLAWPSTGPEHRRMLLNGRKVPEGGTKLQHMDRITLGHVYLMRVVIPKQADAAADKAENTWNLADEGGLEKALEELLHTDQKTAHAVQGMLDHFQDKMGSKKVQEFLEHFQNAQHLVDEANLISKEVRPKDALRFELEVCSDVPTYLQDEPALIVRLYQDTDEDHHCGEGECLDIFELEQFEVRLHDLRDIYEEFHHRPENFANLDWNNKNDPWDTYTHEDVYKMVHEVLKDTDAELQELEDFMMAADAKIAELTKAEAKAKRAVPKEEELTYYDSDDESRTTVSPANTPRSPPKIDVSKCPLGSGTLALGKPEDDKKKKTIAKRSFNDQDGDEPTKKGSLRGLLKSVRDQVVKKSHPSPQPGDLSETLPMQPRTSVAMGMQGVVQDRYKRGDTNSIHMKRAGSGWK